MLEYEHTLSYACDAMRLGNLGHCRCIEVYNIEAQLAILLRPVHLRAS